MENNKGNILFHISISQAKLNQLCNAALDQALSNEQMEVNGVEVVLRKTGTAELHLEGKEVLLDVPLDIHVKRNAGLFTVEGTGEIALKIKIDYDITSNLKLKCKSDIQDHEWLTKPRLEIGALSIPIETLLNLVLKHQESILTAKVDNALSNAPDFGHLLLQQIQTAEEQINAALPFDADMCLQVESIHILPPKRNADDVLIEGALNVNISNNRVQKNIPSIVWVEQLPEDNPLKVGMDVSYEDIARITQDRLAGIDMSGRKIELSDIDITYDDELSIETMIIDPIKGKALLKGIPHFDKNEGTLDLREIDIKVNPNNIIYKVTTPLVNSFMRKKAESLLPVDVQATINTSIDRIPTTIKMPLGEIKLSFDAIKIEQIDFVQNGITLEASVEKMDIQAKLS